MLSELRNIYGLTVGITVFLTKFAIMAKEIERKFLVESDAFMSHVTKSYDIIQGYLSDNPEATVRIRLRGNEAFLTVKGLSHGVTRDEWEYPIPVDDARSMLAICPPDEVLSKTRYICGRWEIDRFHGRHKGLILAEIELTSADESVEIPDFIGREVTGDPRYYNSVLAKPSH